MCWPVTVVVLVHLGATLTGAWRASQPRLQFTHSGKTPAFCLFLLRVRFMSDTSVTLSRVSHANTQLLIFHFSFCPPPLWMPTHTQTPSYAICGARILLLPLSLFSFSNISSGSVITCIKFCSQSYSLSVAPPTSLSHLIPTTEVYS